ncbi:hypothetical protein D9M70_545590 [compost metagenome]
MNDSPEYLAIGPVLYRLCGIRAIDWRLRLQRHDILLQLLPRSPSAARRANNGSAAISLIHFGSAANAKLVALPKKSCFLKRVVKNQDCMVGDIGEG